MSVVIVRFTNFLLGRKFENIEHKDREQLEIIKLLKN